MAKDDTVSVKRSVITKTASAMKKVVSERDEALRKSAAAEQILKRYQDNCNRLFKLASMDQLRYEEIPEMLERLSEMDEQEQDLELRAMEKAANRALLNFGEVGVKTAQSNYGDPITDLVMQHVGF